MSAWDEQSRPGPWQRWKRAASAFDEEPETGGGQVMSSGIERRACEFHLLRYVPDAVRNEYVHIGVILREQGGPGQANPDAARPEPALVR